MSYTCPCLTRASRPPLTTCCVTQQLQQEINAIYGGGRHLLVSTSSPALGKALRDEFRLYERAGVQPKLLSNKVDVSTAEKVRAAGLEEVAVCVGGGENGKRGRRLGFKRLKRLVRFSKQN